MSRRDAPKMPRQKVPRYGYQNHVEPPPEDYKFRNDAPLQSTQDGSRDYGDANSHSGIGVQEPGLCRQDLLSPAIPIERRGMARHRTTFNIIPIWYALQLQGLEILSELAAQAVTAKRIFHSGFEEAEFVPCVVARALEAQGVDGAAAQHVAESVGELNLAAGAGVDGLQGTENIRGQYIAADDGEVGGRFVLLGFFHQIADTEDAVGAAVVHHRFGIQAAVQGDVLGRDLHHGQHRGAEKGMDVKQLTQAGGFGFDHVVGQDYREGFAAHQFHGAQHGMPQP